MAQSRMNDYFGSCKRQQSNASKRRKIESTDFPSKGVIDASETLHDIDKNVRKSLEPGLSPSSNRTPKRGQQKTTPARTTRSSARKKQNVAGQSKIQDAFERLSWSSKDSDVKLPAETVTEEVTSYGDEHDGSGSVTPKRKTRSGISVEVPAGGSQSVKVTRRKARAIRKEQTDTITPQKDVFGKDEKAPVGRSLAQNLQTKLAWLSSDSAQNKAIDDDQEVVSILRSGSTSNSSPPSDRVGETQGSSTRMKTLPSDEEVQHVFVPENLVAISPLPTTPQNFACRSNKSATVTSPRMKASMEKLKMLQNEDGSENTSESVVNSGNKTSETDADMGRKASETVAESTEKVLETMGDGESTKKTSRDRAEKVLETGARESTKKTSRDRTEKVLETGARESTKKTPRDREEKVLETGASESTKKTPRDRAEKVLETGASESTKKTPRDRAEKVLETGASESTKKTPRDRAEKVLGTVSDGESAKKTYKIGAEKLSGTVAESTKKTRDVATSSQNMAETAADNVGEVSEVVEKKTDSSTGVSEIVTKKTPKNQKVIPTKVVREKLAKCGKLDELKSKLAEMNSSLKAARKLEAKRNRAEVEGKADEGELLGKDTTVSADQAEKKPSPAYERYAHLVSEGPPTLALPRKYQLLLNMFQGTDTVVSMLFNRQEIISFSKLKAAVQSMTRKNFEQRNLGQMKTVYPDAYTFRQEKGLPTFGQKESGYQLTVEPSLEGVEEPENQNVARKSGKPNMSAAVLLKRKRIFHNSLVHIAKDHHADFLSKQNPPIEIPASKLTRWHPRFGLDSVPDIEPSELPKPPAKEIQTAKQILESCKGKLPARVEKAMVTVAKRSEKSSLSQSNTSEQQKNTASTSGTSKPTCSALKGIPLALLEKIRAKEAAKAQEALTRDPREDKKTEMIRRLPNLIRSLRTFYVTEKKPSLPYNIVVEKLVDSYATFISPVMVESHLTLLQELAPKWLQVIQIARGKYIKIDKNMDISSLITKLNDLAESRS